MIVYKITNSVNGKVYIGKTAKTFDQRWRSHVKAAKEGSPIYFHKAIRKYGTLAFFGNVICRASTPEELNLLERFYIGVLNANRCGYNLTSGGEGTPGHKVSKKTREHLRKIALNMPEEQRRKLADASRGNTNRRGQQHTAAAKRKLAAYRGPLSSMFGRKHTEETKKKMRLAALGNQRRLGMYHSEATLQKMRDAWVLRKQRVGAYKNNSLISGHAKRS
jgi:group I intron endonuclease